MLKLCNQTCNQDVRSCWGHALAAPHLEVLLLGLIKRLTFFFMAVWPLRIRWIWHELAPSLPLSKVMMNALQQLIAISLTHFLMKRFRNVHALTSWWPNTTVRLVLDGCMSGGLSSKIIWLHSQLFVFLSSNIFVSTTVLCFLTLRKLSYY